MRSESTRERFRRHELDGMPKNPFEKVAERNQVVERLLPGRKLHEKVDIAIVVRHVPSDRAEQRKATHAEVDDFALGGGDARLDVGPRRGLGEHIINLSLQHARATAPTRFSASLLLAFIE